MNRPSKATLLFATGVVAVSVALGFVFSRTHWGYWWAPPRLGAISRVTHLESFVAVWPQGAYSHQPPSGPAAYETAARFGARKSPSFPMGRLPASLAARGLSLSSDDPAAGTYFPAALAALAQSGLLVDGKAGYTKARDFAAAYLALGRTGAGSRILLVSTHGGPVSNDHYAQYDAAFAITPSGSLQPLEMHRYFFDVAGLEGLNAWRLALFAVIPAWFLGIILLSFLPARKAV